MKAFAEDLAGPGDSLMGLPDRIALMSEIGDPVAVAREWLESSKSSVRRWALALLAPSLAEMTQRDKLLPTLLPFVRHEKDEGVRRAALQAMFTAGVTEPLYRGLFDLARDAGVGQRLAGDLVDIGAPAALVDEVRLRIEETRETICPECKKVLRKSERDEHLRKAHDYVQAGDALLPLGEALRELWRLVLAKRDPKAMPDLAALLLKKHGQKATASFKNALLQQAKVHQGSLADIGPENNLGAEGVDLAGCLAAHELSLRVCRELLTHDDPLWRKLARRALLSKTGPTLASADAPAIRKCARRVVPSRRPRHETRRSRLAVKGRRQRDRRCRTGYGVVRVSPLGVSAMR